MRGGNCLFLCTRVRKLIIMSRFFLPIDICHLLMLYNSTCATGLYNHNIIDFYTGVHIILFPIIL